MLNSTFSVRTTFPQRKVTHGELLATNPIKLMSTRGRIKPHLWHRASRNLGYTWNT